MKEKFIIEKRFIDKILPNSPWAHKWRKHKVYISQEKMANALQELLLTKGDVLEFRSGSK